MMSHCDASVLVIFQQTQPFLDILFHVYKRYYTALNSDYSAPYVIHRWALNKYFRKICGTYIACALLISQILSTKISSQGFMPDK